jgi:WhiB family redox-sensing transcriptional regulator
VRAWDWQDAAACRDMPLAWFFPAGAQEPDPRATAACARCPVWEDCLHAALERREHGLWGGLTEDERAAEHRRRTRRSLAAQKRDARRRERVAS